MKKLFSGIGLVCILCAILAIASATSVMAEPVNINKADAKTISKNLDGIGAKKAKAIVAYRTENGDFPKASDIIKVKGIGKKTFKKNKDDILIKDNILIKEK